MERAVEQAGVAEAHVKRARARRLASLHRESENLGVGGLDISAAIAFETALTPFAALPCAGAEDRPEIRILRLPPCFGRGEIGEADGNCVVRPKAELFAGRAAGQKQAAADFLARHIEKHRGGLQAWRLDAAEA